MNNNFKQWNLDQKRLEFKEQERQIIAKAEQMAEKGGEQ